MRVLWVVCALGLMAGCGGSGAERGEADLAALRGRVEHLERQNRLLSNRLKFARGVDCPAGLERQDAMGVAVICVQRAAFAHVTADEVATGRPVIWRPKPSIWRPLLRSGVRGWPMDLPQLHPSMSGEADLTGL